MNVMTMLGLEPIKKKKVKKKNKDGEEEEDRPAARPAAFDLSEEEAGTELSSSMRYFLALKWKKMPDSEKEEVRSQRARRGIHCPICGTIGYYQETCPIDHTPFLSPPSTPDSFASTPPVTPPPTPPGLGILWGALGFEGTLGEHGEGGGGGEGGNAKHVKRKVDLRPLRGNAIDAQAHLQAADKGIGAFEFFTQAEEGYGRTLPEMTLHQLLRRLMRILQKQINDNADKLEAHIDTTLLHPPAEKGREKFYPPELEKVPKHKDYFLAKEAKNERGEKLAHKFQGSLRTSDALDPLFRGGSKEVELSMYKTDPNAGQTMHSKIGWKSVLSHSDMLAVSDPAAAAKQQEVANLFKMQGAWTEKQKKDMSQRNDRFEHLVFIIKEEMKAEHAREAKELSAENKKTTKKANMDVWLDRLNSVDKLMDTLKAYSLTGSLDEADLLVYSLAKWQDTIRAKLPQMRGGASTTAGSTRNGSKNPQQGGSRDTSSAGGRGGSGGGGGGGGGGGDGGNNKKGAKGNAMLAAGASPYYESEMALERAEKLKKRLSIAGGWGAKNDVNKGGTTKLKSQTNNRSATSLLLGHYSDTIATGTGDGEDSQADAANFDESSLASEDSSFVTGVTGDTMDEARAAAKRGAKAKNTPAALAASIDMALKEGEESVQAAEKRKIRPKEQWKAKTFTRKYKRHQREVDEEEMGKARDTFKHALLEHHIRKGNKNDVAYLAPTLIPVPGAFEGDGKDILSSYVGENIINAIRKDLLDSGVGYVPQRLLPLYVRNTVIEPNGTTPAGDQTQEVMALDRRYTHYMGRALNRFEPGKELVDSKEFLKTMGKGFGPNEKEREARLAPLREAKAKRATAKRIADMRYHPMNRALVRLAFKATSDDPKDIFFRES